MRWGDCEGILLASSSAGPCDLNEFRRSTTTPKTSFSEFLFLGWESPVVFLSPPKKVNSDFCTQKSELPLEHQSSS